MRGVANSTWSQSLLEISNAIRDDWFLASQDPNAQQTQAEILNDINQLANDDPQKIIQTLLSSGDEFWRAHNSTPALSISGATNSFTGAMSKLDEWAHIEDSKLKADHLVAMGYFVTPAPAPPLPELEGPKRGETITLRILEARLSAFMDVWVDRIAPYSHQTVAAPLVVATRSAIRSILERFKYPLQEAEMAIQKKALGVGMDEQELEEVIIAEVNTICSRAALDEVGSTEVFDDDDESARVISDIVRAAGGSPDLIQHLVLDEQLVV